MRRYAADTSVSEGRSRDEIERILERFGAEEFVYGRSRSECRAMVGFRFSGMAYRIQVPMPSEDEPEIGLTSWGQRRAEQGKPTEGYERSARDIERRLGQERRRRWRVMAAYIKALVVGVEEGVLTWEEALLPYALLQSGRTVAEEMVPRMAAALESGRLSMKLLPAMAEIT